MTSLATGSGPPWTTHWTSPLIQLSARGLADALRLVWNGALEVRRLRSRTRLRSSWNIRDKRNCV